MKLHPLRDRLRQERLLGMFIGLPCPSFVESLGDSGCDLLVLDAEHANFNARDVEDVIRASEIAGLPALVRMAEIGPDIARVLDLGAAGVIVPRIESAAQAAEVVDRVRYAPEGSRGVGGGRASRYGANLGHYLEHANSHLVAAVMIETSVGLDALDAIAATPGLDALCVGPLDLSISLGVPLGSAAMVAATQRIFDAAHRNGLQAITVCLTRDDVHAAYAAGAQLVLYGLDRLFAVNAISQAMAEIRRPVG